MAYTISTSVIQIQLRRTSAECNMLLPSFLIYASLGGLAAVSTTANAKQIQSKLVTDEVEQDY